MSKNIIWTPIPFKFYIEGPEEVPDYGVSVHLSKERFLELFSPHLGAVLTEGTKPLQEVGE